MDAALTAKVLRLIGLGMRSRGIVVGVEQVREAVKKDDVRIAFVAPDASHNSRDKVVPLVTARRVRLVEGPTAAELGAAVGRDQTVAVGIVDPQLANGIRRLLDESASGNP